MAADSLIQMEIKKCIRETKISHGSVRYTENVVSNEYLGSVKCIG